MHRLTRRQSSKPSSCVSQSGWLVSTTLSLRTMVTSTSTSFHRFTIASARTTSSILQTVRSCRCTLRSKDSRDLQVIMTMMRTGTRIQSNGTSRGAAIWSTLQMSQTRQRKTLSQTFSTKEQDWCKLKVELFHRQTIVSRFYHLHGRTILNFL